MRIEQLSFFKADSEPKKPSSRAMPPKNKLISTPSRHLSTTALLFMAAILILIGVPSTSALACFYCSEHYLTCETYQRYQLCQPNEDRCYVIRSADQIMQGCGQSFMPYCSQQQGVCCTGDLCNCYGRQCPVRAGAASIHFNLAASSLAVPVIFAARHYLL